MVTYWAVVGQLKKFRVRYIGKLLCLESVWGAKQLTADESKCRGHTCLQIHLLAHLIHSPAIWLVADANFAEEPFQTRDCYSLVARWKMPNLHLWPPSWVGAKSVKWDPPWDFQANRSWSGIVDFHATKASKYLGLLAQDLLADCPSKTPIFMGFYLLVAKIKHDKYENYSRVC